MNQSLRRLRVDRLDERGEAPADAAELTDTAEASDRADPIDEVLPRPPSAAALALTA